MRIRKVSHLLFAVLLSCMAISTFASCDEDNYYEELQDVTNTINNSSLCDDNNDLVLKIERFMSQDWGEYDLQDGDCYGDYYFQFKNFNKKILITNLKSKEFLGAVELTANSKNHCNTVSFSRLFYDKDDEFPLLYVSGSMDGKYNHVQVYRIQRMEYLFSFTKIQEITLPQCNQKNHLYWTGAAMDNENGFMYVYANDGGAHIAKFSIPDILQENVILTDEDILEQFSLPGFTHQQGAVIRNGLLYVMDGVPHSGDTNYLRIIDLVNKKDFEMINISALGYGNIEFESLSYYEDCFITASSGYLGVFSIHFLKK